jgi:hypothetical protein
MPRTFASPAFLREVEPGTFMLYRSVEVETEAGGREKVRDICVSERPLRRFDPRNDDRRAIVLRSSHPLSGELLELVEVD